MLFCRVVFSRKYVLISFLIIFGSVGVVCGSQRQLSPIPYKVMHDDSLSPNVRAAVVAKAIDHFWPLAESNIAGRGTVVDCVLRLDNVAYNYRHCNDLLEYAVCGTCILQLSTNEVLTFQQTWVQF